MSVMQTTEERIRQSVALSTMAPGKIEVEGHVLRYSNRRTTPLGTLVNVVANWLRFNDEVWLTEEMALFIVGSDKHSTAAITKLEKMYAFDCSTGKKGKGKSARNIRVVRRGPLFNRLLKAIEPVSPARSFIWVPEKGEDGYKWAARANWQEDKVEDAISTAFAQVMPESDRKVLLQLARLDDGTGARLSIRDLAEPTDITKSTAHRAVARLTEAGYVSSTISGVYYVGNLIHAEEFQPRVGRDAQHRGTQSTKSWDAMHNTVGRKAQSRGTPSPPENPSKQEEQEEQEEQGCAQLSSPSLPPGGNRAERNREPEVGYVAELKRLAQEQAFQGRKGYPSFLAGDYDQLVVEECFEPEYIQSVLESSASRMGQYESVVDFHRAVRKQVRSKASQVAYRSATGNPAGRTSQVEEPQEGAQQVTTAPEMAQEHEKAPEATPASTSVAEDVAKAFFQLSDEDKAEMARRAAEKRAAQALLDGAPQGLTFAERRAWRKAHQAQKAA